MRKVNDDRCMCCAGPIASPVSIWSLIFCPVLPMQRALHVSLVIRYTKALVSWSAWLAWIGFGHDFVFSLRSSRPGAIFQHLIMLCSCIFPCWMINTKPFPRSILLPPAHLVQMQRSERSRFVKTDKSVLMLENTPVWLLSLLYLEFYMALIQFHHKIKHKFGMKNCWCA